MPHKNKLIISVILSVLAYLIWAGAADIDAVWSSAARVGWTGFGLVLSLSLVNYALRFVRWQSYLGALGQAVPIAQSARYYVAGFALTTTPGKAGEAIRSLLLKRYSVPYSTSLAALFAERLTDIVSVVIIAAGGIAAFPRFRWMAVLMAVVALVVLVLTRSSILRDAIERRAGAGRQTRVRSLLQHGTMLLDAASKLLVYRRLASGIALGVVAWGAEALAFAYLVHAIGYPLPIAVVAAVYAISMLAGAVSFMPGGLGGAEAAMGVMLYALGLAAPDIVSATLICRLSTLWFAVVLGLGALGTSLIDEREGRAQLDRQVLK
jgi:glycosyltransferase 2 family protein